MCAPAGTWSRASASDLWDRRVSLPEPTSISVYGATANSLISSACDRRGNRVLLRRVPVLLALRAMSMQL
jgi:hypothetical protein